MVIPFFNYGQSAIQIESQNDTISFQVNVNNTGYLTSVDGKILITELKAGTQQLIIGVDNKKVLEKAVYTVEGQLHTFKIKQIGDLWRLSIYSEEPLPKNLLNQKTDSTTIVSLDSISQKITTVLMDSNMVTGCDSLISLEAFEALQSKYNDIIFESKRVTFLEYQLGNYCISTQQFADLIKNLDYEENKVNIIQKYYKSVFDISNFEALKEELILQQSINQFNAFINSEEFKQLQNKNNK